MEGQQVIMLLLKLLKALIDSINRMISNSLRLMGRAAAFLIRDHFRKKELGFKNSKDLKNDRSQLETARTIKKDLETREKTLESKIRESKYNLDAYKLDKQSQLFELEKKIRVTSNNLDTLKANSKGKENSKEIELLEKDLNGTIKEKSDFEQKVNKTLLNKNREIENLENEYKHTKDHLKICDRAIDGFASKKHGDIPESLRSNFESVVKEHSIYKQQHEINETKTTDSKDPNKEHEQNIKENTPEVKKENQEKDKDENKLEQTYEHEIDTLVKAEVVNEIVHESETITKEVEKDFIAEDSKNFINNNEKEHTKSEKAPAKKEKEKDVDDEFMKDFLEKQRRKTLAKNLHKDKDIKNDLAI